MSNTVKRAKIMTYIARTYVCSPKKAGTFSCSQALDKFFKVLPHSFWVNSACDPVCCSS